MVAKMESKYLEIDGFKIHYQTCGHGPSVLLLIHGTVGSTNDFVFQMTHKELGLDQGEFTIVAYDMPGLGKSDLLRGRDGPCRPDPTPAYFKQAAKTGAALMARLEHSTYAVGGWSDGARVAALLAIEHQSRVDALVLWGFMPVMDEKSAKAISKTRDISIWNPSALELYVQVYGQEEFSEIWRHYVDYIMRALEWEPEQQFDIRTELSKIKCPTLILHGTEDPIVSYQDHIRPLYMQIYNSDIKQFKGMAHNLHQADPHRFNQELTTFVTSLRV